MAQAKRDNNFIPTMLAVSNADGTTPVVLWADPTTHRLLVSATSSDITDTIAASTYGIAFVELQPVLAGTTVATGDLNGNIVFRVPAEFNGWNLVTVGACVVTAGTTGTTDIQIHNITQAADMLSTKITIDSTETDSSTAAAAAVIDTSNDDVATGDQIRIDVDAVTTTPPQGLVVTLGFQAP